MDSAHYMRRAEEFAARLYTEERLHLSGLKDTFETEAIFDEFQDLFTHRAVLQRLEHREDRIGRYLAEFAVHNYVEQRLSHLTDRIATAQNATTVQVGDEYQPFYQALGQLTREPDRSRRLLLEEGVAAALAPQNADRAKRIAGQREIARELGFADYLVLCEELSSQPLRALGKQMAAFLDDTEPAYRSRIARALQGAGINPAEATDADLRWLLFAPRHLAAFPCEMLLPAAQATMTRLGLGDAQLDNLHLDLEPRSNKTSRPFCAPVRVPGEVWVVASPRGGWVDYLSFFHELGHAQHLAYTDPGLPFPCRFMGDDAVGETFAFLLQSLVLEPEWLRDVMCADAISGPLFESGQLVDFWHVRRYAGKIVYELELHGTDGPVTEMAVRYAGILTHAMGVRVAPEHYLFDVDDRFYSASCLRAWIFDTCLRRHFRERFGRLWFQCPEAGALLRSLWRRGRELTAEELAEELGLELGLGPLCERLLAAP